MKSIYYSLMLCLLFSAIGFSQQDNKNSMLFGEWLFQFDKSFTELEYSSKKYLDSIPNVQLQEIHSNYKGRKIFFEPNGDFVQLLSDGRKVLGKWILDSANNTLEIMLPNGAIYYQKLQILDRQSILLTPDQGANIIVNKWYYNKL